MKIYKGIAGSPGIARAKVLYFEKKSGKKRDMTIDEAAKHALAKVRELQQKTLEDFGEDKAKIFSAYEMLLEDNNLIGPMKQLADAGESAENAIRGVTEKMAAVLASKKSEYMRQRADDMRYIGELLIDVINGSDEGFSFPDDGEKYILVAHELTPVDTMLFDRGRLAGLVCELGGATSHTVILAKSIGIPAVVGADGIKEAAGETHAYLDGYNGIFVTSPDEETEKKYERLFKEEMQLSEKLAQIKKTDAYTKDGVRVAVAVNIGKPSDLNGADEENFDGVGLFRSEFLYSSASEQPSLSQQYEAYKKVIDTVYPNPVTIRTIDVGGDKQLSYLHMKHEENPFLGNRGIRLCLSNTEIFTRQLEAIMTAGAGKSVKVMLPMITCIDEIKKTKQLISDIQKRLKSENTPYCSDLRLGIMIETPASAIMADTFAKRCDFFSIGTNDLVQYIMAADRGNADVEKLYNPYHPAVIKMLANVIRAGSDAEIEVSVCGDLAANTSFTALLVGLGLRKFSVPLPMVSRIKYKIASTDSSEAKKLAEEVLSAEDENEIMQILRKEF